MESKYYRILKAEGKEAASAYMREIASKAKKPNGMASLPVEKRKEIMAKVRKAKNVIRENKD